MTRARYSGERLALALARALAATLPRRGLLRLGGWVGGAAYAVDRRHRQVTLDNLRLALGDVLDARERNRVARRCWAQLGRNTLDTLSFERLPLESLQRLVCWEGLDHLRAAYRDGRGTIVFSGHFGHWELTALMQGYLGLPLTLLTRPLDNGALDAALTTLRQRSGNRVQPKRGASRVLVRELRAGRGVALVIDQDARESGIFVPYFGRPASTTSTLARMARRTGAAAVPTFCVPLSDGRYRIVYEAPLDPPRDDSPRELRRFTAEATARLEAWVRRHPEHWMWAHRRWKTVPPTDPAPAAADCQDVVTSATSEGGAA